MQGWMLSAHHIMIDRTFPDDLACSSFKNTCASMNNSGYDELNKKYQDLLEENRYLKARIKKLEAEPHSLESHPKALNDMEKGDRIRACNLHACLKYVNRDYMTNSTLRERFGIEVRNSAIASRIIRETIEAGLVRPYEIPTVKEICQICAFLVLKIQFFLI